jgi:HlyD family secretion protein
MTNALLSRSAAVLLVGALGSAACSTEQTQTYQGYAEGEYVRVAAPFAGNLTALHVTRGSQVTAGVPLFALEQDSEAEAQREAAARLAQAEARLENLKKGRRAPEMAAIQAQLAQAEARLTLSEAEWRRRVQLADAHLVAEAELDQARTTHERDKAQVNEIASQLATARLPARPDEIRAAAAEVAASHAALRQADWKLAQKSPSAPVDGLVADTMYVQGEWVPAGSSVVSLLPPQNIKVRFFVPEPALGAVHVGQHVTLSCNGCAKTIGAQVSYIAPQAEYTPPVIYSKDSRSKLVFLVEARPAAADATLLRPGQPVDVRLDSP